ncbi:11240_t:CDS:2 [Gigaspora margarita]|uniref:11240_t:CDS:1 n=1 Tax=Gigaspora margarita TaxID=4874 RepID=A0ABM8W0A5_GIGMA|nr:11240_t:CDS:2 [Gigaspora margarita]
MVSTNVEIFATLIKTTDTSDEKQYQNSNTKGNDTNDELPAHTTISSNNDCSCNDDDTRAIMLRTMTLSMMTPGMATLMMKLPTA